MDVDKETKEKAEDVSFNPRTSLGKKLLEKRNEIIASGEKMLDWKDIEREVSDRRGGYENRK
jgi:hypothetical protein